MFRYIFLFKLKVIIIIIIFKCSISHPDQEALQLFDKVDALFESSLNGPEEAFALLSSCEKEVVFIGLIVLFILSQIKPLFYFFSMKRT